MLQIIGAILIIAAIGTFIADALEAASNPEAAAIDRRLRQ